MSVESSPERQAVPGAGSVDPRDHPPCSFADGDWQWFCDRARDLGLNPLPVTRDGVEALYGHLLGVNRWLNLTRVADGRAYLERHLLDSLVLLAQPWFRSLRLGSCCDLGSGGGYPGLPLALACPDQQWLLVDSRERKVRFLAAAGALIDGQRVQARAFRGREVGSHAADCVAAFDVVTTRATGSIDVIAAEAAALLRPGGRLVVWQGPSCDAAEVARCQRSLGKRWSDWQREPYALSAEDPQRVLVSLRWGGR